MGIKKGFSTLEILIASSILVIIAIFIFYIIFFTLKQTIFYQKFIQANYLAQEGQEIARRYKEEQDQEINGFFREIKLEEVYRDNDGNISETGVLDSETLKVIVSVSFDNQTIKLINYLTNWDE